MKIKIISYIYHKFKNLIFGNCPKKYFNKILPTLMHHCLQFLFEKILYCQTKRIKNSVILLLVKLLLYQTNLSLITSYGFMYMPIFLNKTKVKFFIIHMVLHNTLKISTHFDIKL